MESKPSLFDQTILKGKGDYPFRMSLNFKFILILAGVLLIGVVTSSILVLNLQREQLIDGIEAASMHANSAIEAGLDHAMLTNDITMEKSIIQSVVSPGGIERVQIMNVQGVVMLSSDPAGVGRQFDPNEPICQSCHPYGEGPRSIVYTPGVGRAAELLSVTPIRNEPACMACHDSKTPVLGLMLTETSLVDLNNNLAAGEGRIVLSTLVTFVVMAGLILLALRRFVIGPVDILAKNMVEIGSGNLDHSVPAGSNDEIGGLARAFDSMRHNLKESRGETERSNRELGVLHQVALATGQLVALEQTLRDILKIVVEKLEMQTGIIYLWDDRQKRFERIVNLGLSDYQLSEIDRRRKTEGGDLTKEIASTGSVHYVPDMSNNRHFEGLFDNLSQRAYINVPLKSQGKVVGTMELSTQAGGKLTEREIDLIRAVGNEIGIAIDNTGLLAETRRNAKEATTLYELGSQISASLELVQVLHEVAEGARAVLSADVGVIGLVEPSKQEVAIKAFSGDHSDSLNQLRVPIHTEQGHALSVNKPIIVEDATLPGEGEIAGLVQLEGMGSFLAVPLWRNGGLRGLVGIMTRSPRRYSILEVRLLTRLAQQTIAAIENAQLYEQVQYVSILEERERIAREIHDGLAQLVGSIRIWAEEAELSLAEKNWKASRGAIKKVEESARVAYASLREEMMGLRETLVPGEDIFPVLTEYLSRFQNQSGIRSRLQVRRTTVEKDPIALSPNVEIQLLRIIQEGLTNVHRHAKAQHVLVDCTETAETLSITIEDDGEGFIPANVPEGHLGLRIMSERAASVGGQVSISSELGRGTRLEIEFPRKGMNHSNGSAA